MVFNGFPSCSPGPGLLATVASGYVLSSPVGPTHSANVTASSGRQGPHDFALRSASFVNARRLIAHRPLEPALHHTLRRLTAAASTAPHPASVTIRDTPLCGVGTVGINKVFYQPRSEICFESGLDMILPDRLFFCA